MPYGRSSGSDLSSYDQQYRYQYPDIEYGTVLCTPYTVLTQYYLRL